MLPLHHQCYKNDRVEQQQVVEIGKSRLESDRRVVTAECVLLSSCPHWMEAVT